MESIAARGKSNKPDTTDKIVEFLRCQRGAVLVITLILCLLCMMMTAGLSTMILTETRMSGLGLRYTSSVEAAKGAVEDFIANTPFDHKGVSGDSDYKCKLQQDTANWSITCVGYSTSHLSDHATPQDVVDYADWSQSYGNFRCYAKIVDSRGTANGNWIYTIDVVSMSPNGSEYSWYTVIYKY